MMVSTGRPTFLFVRHPRLEDSWPFLHERMVERLSALGDVRVHESAGHAPLSEEADVREVVGLALYGGKFTVQCVAAMPRLRMVSANTDNAGWGLPVEALLARDIPIVETTRAWAESVAECAIALTLCSLRSVGQWHARMAAGEPLWRYAAGQFCDNPDFVNGDLGSKSVGVLGMGQIGRRIARWCRAFGATVCAYDPFVPDGVFEDMGVARGTMDGLVERAEIVFVAVPPTPSARHLLNRDRIYRLRKGSLVTVITRAHAVDMAALRERILADELAGAFDVYDVEPLPVDDPLRNRPNVTHTPHIAGRTKDANLRTADITADEFRRILNGQPPTARLTPEAIRVRTQAIDLHVS
jgi:D-3-phosphoglycerate dehydrogenase